MSRLFDPDKYCGGKIYGDISSWNTSSVRTMQSMFAGAKSFNQDLSKWDVSQVTDMLGMFSGAKSFNQDLSKWNVSQVTNMHKMFAGAKSFNQDLSKWNVSQVTNMHEMFARAQSFNQSLCWLDSLHHDYAAAIVFGWSGNGRLSICKQFMPTSSESLALAVRTVCQAVNNVDFGHISTWDVGEITDMTGLFHGFFVRDCARIWGDISNWNTSSVTNMQAMFAASSFNQDLSNWDVSQVTNMQGMFLNASSFNQDLSKWNVSQVTDMQQMFAGASAFSQEFCWNYRLSAIGYTQGDGLVTEHGFTRFYGILRGPMNSTISERYGTLFCECPSGEVYRVKDGVPICVAASSRTTRMEC